MSFFDKPDIDLDGPGDSAVVPARRGRRAAAAALATGLVVTVLSVVQSSSAVAEPTANDWHRLRVCESSNNYQINTGNGHYGAYQFDMATWRSVGGSGLPSNASRAEQDKRALMLYRKRGWQPWQCASMLGLPVRSGSSGGSSTGQHGWPGTSYSYGEHNAQIARWQKQMRNRGAPLEGTGQFGPITLSVAKALQRQNGLPGGGTIGPKTWELAWTGHYHQASTPKPAKPKPVTKPKPAPATVPAWPGAYYLQGQHNTQIARWQKQMHKRGAPLQGTGQFGPVTLSVVTALQRQNGLVGEGTLGPLTWNLAWTGRYHHGATKAKAVTVPKWPGAYYSRSQHNAQIARWQKQMHKRGAPLQGTGQFGPVTVSVVKTLQRQNGLDPVGFIGPNTWALAWTGTYHR